MFDNTRRNRRALAGIVGVNLALALAVSAGAVPLSGAHDDGRSAATVASAAVTQEPAATVRQAGDGVSAAMAQGSAATTPPPVPTAEASKATGTTVAPTTVPVVTAGRSAAAAPTAARPTVTVPAVATPSVAAGVVAQVARRVPAAAEVQQAISNLPQHVRSIIKPSPAQVAQLGTTVCGMFDAGQSFAQVKATGLQMVTQVPLTTVLPGGADWVVETVVTLYCPGHLAKIG